MFYEGMCVILELKGMSQTSLTKETLKTNNQDQDRARTEEQWTETWKNEEKFESFGSLEDSLVKWA